MDRTERLGEIAQEYAKQPEGTLVVSPDNESRRDINQAIHTEMQARGQVDTHEYKQRVLVARQEITGADRQWAMQYEPGDVVRYTRGSKTHGIDAGEYARVEGVKEKENLVTVKRENGEHVTYDPRRLHGVTLYRETERAFSKGDRVQFTAPNREQRIANRELGTIEKMNSSSNVQVHLDLGRTIVQRQRESASRLRLRRDQPQQPGPNRRPRAHSNRHRTRRRQTRQSPFGVCGRVAWPLRRPNLHERQKPSHGATVS